MKYICLFYFVFHVYQDVSIHISFRVYIIFDLQQFEKFCTMKKKIK